MRSLFIAAVSALTLAACASQAPAPAPAAAPAPAKPAAAAPAPAPAKAPQCYSSDHGKFFDVGSRAAISGVDVVCQPTSDGKGAQWMGAKSKH